jgi:ATP-dependent helicase/nuclease subunit A
MQARELHAAAHEAGAPFNTPSLAMSFRSVRQVLSYVDDVFDPQHFSGDAPFTVQVPVELGLTRHTPPAAARNRLRRTLAARCTRRDSKSPIRGTRPSIAPPDRCACPTRQTIAAFIRREIEAGAASGKNKQRPAKPGDFLILVKRRTGGIFDGILQQLKARNIPVAGADRIQLLDSAPCRTC